VRRTATELERILRDIDAGAGKEEEGDFEELTEADIESLLK
jgi:hypothetical protein